NYPNPFNPTTTIKFALPDAGRVRLVVYNILGQKVRELVDGFKDAGRYEVLWNGRNDKGQLVSSGLYIYRLESVKGIQSRKMLLVK
ncbi:MAG: T9SS type A sorting domain-containing protein, partial [Bacteroidetes bacterium]|nr:T9SS type A sorting domain-containing protein [Bacteroidota bacterium]